MGKLVGYARVSTVDQSADMQVEALERVCDEVSVEVASGKNADRPQLVFTLEGLRAGDTLVVWKLDRLGRSLSDILRIIDGLKQRGIGFRSLTDGITLGDESNPMGVAMFQLMGVFAELERSLMLERTYAGLAAAKARGRVGGRRSVLTRERAEEIKEQLEEGVPVTEIAQRFWVSRVTVYKVQNGTYVFIIRAPLRFGPNLTNSIT